MRWPSTTRKWSLPMWAANARRFAIEVDRPALAAPGPEGEVSAVWAEERRAGEGVVERAVQLTVHHDGAALGEAGREAVPPAVGADGEGALVDGLDQPADGR